MRQAAGGEMADGRNVVRGQRAVCLGGERAVIEAKRMAYQQARVEIGRIQAGIAECLRQHTPRGGDRDPRRKTGKHCHDAFSCAASNSA
jgi:hypothetical protein